MPDIRLPEPRIAPLPASDWDDDTRAAFEERVAAGGRILNVHATVANHSKLLKSWMAFGRHILRESSLPPRGRELLILRTGWLCQAGYEWAHHSSVAKQVGVSPEEVQRVKEGPNAGAWSNEDRALLSAVDELVNDAFISDATWQALSASFDTRQLLDIIFTVGQYNMISMALNTLGVQLENRSDGEKS